MTGAVHVARPVYNVFTGEDNERTLHHKDRHTPLRFASPLEGSMSRSRTLIELCTCGTNDAFEARATAESKAKPIFTNGAHRMGQ